MTEKIPDFTPRHFDTVQYYQTLPDITSVRAK